MKRIYISGPITADPIGGTRQAVHAAHTLRNHGYAPLVPHLTVIEAMICGDRPYADWLAADLAWVAVSDAVVRLPGASPGADREVAYALKHGIPVHLSVDEFLQEEGHRA